MEISNILEELYEKYNEESQYATLIDKTKVYISGMEFEDDEKINIINALELQICDSYRMDAANLVSMHQYYIPVISYNEISANVNFSLSFNHKIEKRCCKI